MEKSKELAGIIDRVHQLSLHIPSVVADLQIATVLALRELLVVANFNDGLHFSVLSACMYKIWTTLFQPFHWSHADSRVQVQNRRSAHLIELG
jgi:hypothetical protein